MDIKPGKSKRYSREINSIENKLKDLEKGNIFEITGNPLDGDLATNIVQLRKMISQLIQRMD